MSFSPVLPYNVPELVNRVNKQWVNSSQFQFSHHLNKFKMLEEIIAFSLSLCSLFTADTPRVSSNRESALENVNFEFERIENDTPNTFINKEYDDDIRDEIFTKNIIVSQINMQ